MGTGDQVDPEIDAWIAAIHATKDDFRPVGSGIVLDERRILTCYHVVKDMGQPWIAFPKARGDACFTRRQVECIVFPEIYGDVRDVAILVLDGQIPAGVTAAPLRFSEPTELIGKPWWAFGFPNYDPLGSTSGGRIGGALGYGWVRLHRGSPDPVEVGFSGGGLWCPDYKAVVGVVGQADGQSGGGRAITLHEADKLFPGQGLRGLAGPTASGSPDVTPPAPEVAELVESLTDRPDALAIIYEVFARTPAVAPLGATAIQLLSLLHELVQPVGEVPLLEQVSEIAAQRADGWRPAIPEPVDTSLSATELCLSVVIHQDYYDPDNFLMSLTTYQDGQPGQPQECGSPSGALKEIKELLRGLVPMILRSGRGVPLVEFAVPEKLLGTDFDQWPMLSRPDGTRVEDYRLGEKYPVVVRDLERMIPGQVSELDHEKWQSRWKLLLACDGPPQDVLHEVDLQEMVNLQKKGAAFKWLRATLWLPASDGNVMLALVPGQVSASVKPAKAARAVHETLRAGFAAGMPAAIWLRHRSARRPGAAAASAYDDEDDRIYLRNALDRPDPDQSTRLADLPRRVWNLRVEAEATQRHASHPGRRLSLLWADPGRTWTPPTFQLPPRSANGDDL
jgi:vWA-MoxR associated protein C-terminal domain/Trypsin-like peptidase domain